MGKNLLIFVLFAGIGYFAYQHWIAPQPTPAAPTPPVAAEVASAPAPVTTPTPPPTPAAAPAPAPLPSATATAAGAPGSENSGFVSTTPADAQAAAASAPAPAGPETKLIETNVTGYDLNNPINALGVFKAGSELTLADSKITGMKEVVFHAPDGTDIHALCFVKDLNRK
ncbi:MAG: hypothetical protein JO317_03945, partial [Verrucomicrobiae bacterium]|nr:hypothetical protein [Verrucomicrobiae bacterium]